MKWPRLRQSNLLSTRRQQRVCVLFNIQARLGLGCSISEYWSGARHAHTSGQRSSPGSRPIAKGTYWCGPSARYLAGPQIVLRGRRVARASCQPLTRIGHRCPCHPSQWAETSLRKRTADGDSRFSQPFPIPNAAPLQSTAGRGWGLPDAVIGSSGWGAREPRSLCCVARPTFPFIAKSK